MKKSILIVAFFFIGNLAFSQSIFEKWPAIGEFHGVMSQTFHPAEEGNLEPIKTRSAEMLKKAKALLKSDIPDEFRTLKILSAAETIQIQSQYLHKIVKAKGSDALITAKITELHDVFHEIVGLCGSEKH